MQKSGLRKPSTNAKEKVKMKKKQLGDNSMRLHSYVCLVRLLKKRKIFKDIIEENFPGLKNELKAYVGRLLHV